MKHGYAWVVIHRLLSRAYRLPTRPFWVETDDGIRLIGARVGVAGPMLVFCHGFLGWHRKAAIVDFVEHLARWFTVYVFDTRGHGMSGGRSTFGDREYLDVDAVVRRAREDSGESLATLGASMGGIAVLRHAAFRDEVDAVMAVSTPARWDGHRTAAVRRMRLITATRGGRGLMRGLGVRVATTWGWPDDPEEVVGKIAPTPVIIVHGRDDHFFDVEDAWRLYRRAGEPKRLMLARRFGHAEEGFSRAFAERAARRLYEAMGPPRG